MLDPLGVTLVIVINVAFVAIVVTVLVLLIRRRHRQRTRVDDAFVGAPVLPATVLERTHLHWGYNERWAYRIVYRIEPPGAAPFMAEEQRMMTTLFEAPSFKVGTRLLVAVRPDLGTVQAVPGSQQR